MKFLHRIPAAVLVAACLAFIVVDFLAARAIASPSTSVITSTVTAANQVNGRREDILGVVRSLNGSPIKLGVITGAGAASKTNVSTASPFTIMPGSVLYIACDVDAYCIETATASSSYTSADFGFPLSAGKALPFIALPGVTTGAAVWACISAAAYNCAFFGMQ